MVSDDYVLTSYSSIAKADPSGRSLRLYLGGQSGVIPLILTGAPNVSVKRVIRHTQFVAEHGSGFPINDAALLQISLGADLDRTKICSICLTSTAVAQTDCRKIWISGYGSTSEVGNFSDGILRYATVNLIPKAVCETAHRGVFGKEFVIDDQSLCAGGELQDTCRHDGGAPLTCLTHQGDPYLIGILSWGYGCGRPGFHGVYTNLSSLMPWIATTIGH